MAGAPFGFALCKSARLHSVVDGDRNDTKFAEHALTNILPNPAGVIFQGINNYLVDSYTIFSASVLAGTAIIRSVLAAAFPLFTGKMYAALGIHWASSVPAFLALAFAPFPFVLYRYGARVRERCKYSAEAMGFMRELQQGGGRWAQR